MLVYFLQLWSKKLGVCGTNGPVSIPSKKQGFFVFLLHQERKRDSSVGIAAGWATEDLGFDSWRALDILF
jgi:hypothetical protein